MMTQILVMVLALAVILVGGIVMVARSWHRVPQGKALIISKMGTQATVSFTGAVVLPMVHKAEILDVSLKKLVIARRGRDGLICRDNVRADIEVTFFVRVNHTIDDVLRVARSIGCARASEAKTLEELFAAKFSEAIKTVGKSLDFAELYAKRDEVKDQILAVTGTDLNGFVIDDLAIDYLEQTPIEALDPNNILDAEGIRKIRQLTAGAAAARDEVTAARRVSADDGGQLAAQLRELGLLDIGVAVEVSCDVSRQRPAISLRIDGASEQVKARLPHGLPEGVLGAIGTGELICADGRATFRWSQPRVTDAQLVAGARLIHALRDEDSAAYR